MSEITTNQVATDHQVDDRQGIRTIKRAFISVYYKDGLDLVVQELAAQGVEIVSTGKTYEFIQKLGISATPVEDVTDFPEILGGRVKTLHPKVFGGILARRDNKADNMEVSDFDLLLFDLVVVDLYPFEETVKAGGRAEDIIEKIDIGGISLIRAAAKNFNDVLTVSSRDQYGDLLELLQTKKCTSVLEDRALFAAKAFATSSHYDTVIFNYFNQKAQLPVLRASAERFRILKYGENPHQKFAALYSMDDNDPLALHKFTIAYGGSDGYVTLTDVDRSIETIVRICAGTEVNAMPPYRAMVAVKHGNACGASLGSAYEEDLIRDTMSGDCEAVLGAVVACNFKITSKLLELIFRSHDPQGKKWGMLAAIVCKEIDPDAVAILKERKSGCIVYTNTNFDWEEMGLHNLRTGKLFRQVRDGVLVQDAPVFIPHVSKKANDGSHVLHCGDMSQFALTDIILAWAVNATSNSNTITIAREGKLLGNAVGQQKRVASSKLAVEKAQFALQFGQQYSLDGGSQNAIAWGDSFFPYPDGIEVLWKAGVKAVFATHGSKRDEDVINFCREKGMTFVTWPDSVARGFSNH